MSLVLTHLTLEELETNKEPLKKTGLTASWWQSGSRSWILSEIHESWGESSHWNLSVGLSLLAASVKAPPGRIPENQTWLVFALHLMVLSFYLDYGSIRLEELYRIHWGL